MVREQFFHYAIGEQIARGLDDQIDIAIVLGVKLIQPRIQDRLADGFEQNLATRENDAPAAQFACRGIAEPHRVRKVVDDAGEVRAALGDHLSEFVAIVRMEPIFIAVWAVPVTQKRHDVVDRFHSSY